MPSWGEIERDAPELAGLAREPLDAHPRFSLHSGSEDPPDWGGLLYRVDVREPAVTRLTEAKDELAIDWWSEADGLRSLTGK